MCNGQGRGEMRDGEGVGGELHILSTRPQVLGQNRIHRGDDDDGRRNDRHAIVQTLGCVLLFQLRRLLHFDGTDNPHDARGGDNVYRLLRMQPFAVHLRQRAVVISAELAGGQLGLGPSCAGVQWNSGNLADDGAEHSDRIRGLQVHQFPI